MSPSSNTSSVNAQNGSATSPPAASYSDTARASEAKYSGNTYAARTTQAHNPHYRRPVNPMTSTSTPSYQYTNSTPHDQTNGNAYYTEPTYLEQPPYQETTSGDAASSSHQPYETYYLPPYAHEDFSQETITYANELTFDEEQSNAPVTEPYYQGQARIPSYSTNYGNMQGLAGNAIDEGIAEEYTGVNGSYSPTTRRWSAEYSSDERLRLGLPRFETEEQQRQAYEGAAGQYDSTRRH